jgi:hypothetical protein
VGPGTITLRFTSVRGTPGDGPAALIASDMPVVFSKQAFGIQIDTDIDHFVDGMGCEAATGPDCVNGNPIGHGDVHRYGPRSRFRSRAGSPPAATAARPPNSGYGRR